MKECEQLLKKVRDLLEELETYLRKETKRI